MKQFLQGNGGQKHIGRILEFFRTTDGEDYFRVQWFYRIEDTVSIRIVFEYDILMSEHLIPSIGHILFPFVSQVIKEEGAFHDKRRLFYSTLMNDNLIDCIISKVNVTKVTPKVCSILFSSLVNSVVFFFFFSIS